MNFYNPNIKEVVCQNIKKYRKEKGIRLMDLAKMLNMSYDYLRRLEAKYDKNSITLLTLYKISLILDVSIEKFFEE